MDLTTNVGDILLSDSLFDDEKDDTEENDDEFDISELENLAEEESGSDIEVEMAYSSNSSRSEGEKVSHSLVPARMERKDRFSFTLRIDNDEKPKEDSGTRQLKKKKAAVISVQHGTDLVLPDLAKLGSGKKEISVKVSTFLYMIFSVIIDGCRSYFVLLKDFNFDHILFDLKILVRRILWYFSRWDRFPTWIAV